jgi:hypothetical protein
MLFGAVRYCDVDDMDMVLTLFCTDGAMKLKLDDGAVEAGKFDEN